MACEKCWNDAYMRSLHNGKCQAGLANDVLLSIDEGAKVGHE